MTEAIPQYVQWLIESKRYQHPSELETLRDPFDYEAEDQVVAAWRRGDIAALKSVQWKRAPGYGAYFGLQVNPWDGTTQADKHENAGEYDPTKSRRENATHLGGAAVKRTS